MHKSNRATTSPAPSRDLLAETLRDGLQRLLGKAIEVEVADWIESHSDVVDDSGRRQQVVRNGHHPTGTLVTGVGPIDVTQPRVLDQRMSGKIKTARRWTPPVDRLRGSVRRSCRRTRTLGPTSGQV